MKKKIIGSPTKQTPIAVKPIHGMNVINLMPMASQSTPVIVTQPVLYTPQLIKSQSTPTTVIPSIISPPAITQTQIVLPKSTVENQAIASKPVIQTPVIVKQDNSTQLLEEIRILKGFLQQKDALIEKLYNEKQELSNRLVVSETNNVALMREFSELKQDKLDLRADKAKLNDEIQELRHNHHIDLSQKDIKIEQLKKEFTDLTSVNMTQDLSEILEHNDNNNPLLLADSVISIQLNNTIPINQINNNENMAIVSVNSTEILLAGQNSQETHSDFSIIQ